MNYAKTLSMSAAVLATAGLLLVIAPPAAARDKAIVVEAPASSLVVRKVAFADLNLAAIEGRKALERRVGDAVTELCLEATGGFMASSTNAHLQSSCANDAWNEARPQIARAIDRRRQLAENGASSLSAASSITLAIRG